MALIACVGVANLASAATGDLSFRACVADTAAEGCPVAADPALGFVHGIAISPDDRSVYAAAAGDDSVSHFSRAASGSLTYDSCRAETAAEGCVPPLSTALDQAFGVAVSPDGRSVFAIANNDDAITSFTRLGDGRLVFVQCRANTNADNCTTMDDPSLDGPTDVAVSPDSQNVYVASEDGGTITTFTRQFDGFLLGHACFEGTNLTGCQERPALDGARGVAVSADGDSVYVAADADGAVVHFSRANDGSLTFENCVADTNAEGCSVPADTALAGARDAAVSPDGDSVYVVAAQAGAVSHFSRAADGDLTYQECFAATTAEGCRLVAALDEPVSLAVSPDGRSVYVGDAGDNSVSHFSRATNGDLSFSNCVAETAAEGCSVPAPAALEEPQGIVVSADSRSVYVAAEDSSALNHFDRDLGVVAPRCGGRVATKVGTNARNTLRGTAGADVIAGLGGNDVIRGLGGNDVLCGGRGRDRLLGGPGRDRLLGQAGRDVLRGGPGRDKLRGGPGRDLQVQ